jgi:hypothetical protein
MAPMSKADIEKLAQILSEAIQMEYAHQVVTIHTKTARRILQALRDGGLDE